ncbi:MAG TPA: O-antigen ligase family protein [Polyangia bacterium]|nr:O-antigen ligase family protein [Polyangia bacterium]
MNRALGETILPGAALLVALAYAPSLASPFAEVKLAALVLAGALSAAAWLAGRSARAPLDRGIAAAGLAVLATTALAAVLAAPRDIGAPYAAAELVRLNAAAGVALGTALAVSAGRSGPLLQAIQVGAALVSVIGLGQHLQLLPLPIPSFSVPGSTFGNRNVAAEAVAMALPFGLSMLDPPGARGRWWARLVPALLGVEMLYLAAARTRGAWLGGAAGLLVFLALRRPRLSRRVVVGGGLVLALALIGAAVPGRWTAHDAGDAKRFASGGQVVREALNTSSPVARTRLGLWRRTWAMYRAHPLAGIGPGNFAVLFPRYAEPGAADDGVLSPGLAPRQAHDDLLERLAETGPLGLAALLALYAAAGAAAVRRARRPPGARDPAGAAFAAGCAGAVAAFVGCGLTGFPMAMPATLFLLAVALGGLAAADDLADVSPRARPLRPLGTAGWVLGAALVLAGALWCSRRLAASYFLARGEGALRAGDARRALAELDRAGRLAPGDFPAALAAATAASRAGDPANAGARAERALSIEPFSPNAWEALARARLDAGDAAGALAAAERALDLLQAYPAALETRAAAALR